MAPPVVLPAPPFVASGADLRRLERAAARFRLLHQLAADGSLPQAQYDAWVAQNAGALLVLTAPAPVLGVTYETPRYEDVVARLGALAGQNPKAVEAERSALFQLLMPSAGPVAQTATPPADPEQRRRWLALLDSVRDEGLLPAARVDAEKAAIEASVPSRHGDH